MYMQVPFVVSFFHVCHQHITWPHKLFQVELLSYVYLTYQWYTGISRAGCVCFLWSSYGVPYLCAMCALCMPWIHPVMCYVCATYVLLILCLCPTCVVLIRYLWAASVLLMNFRVTYVLLMHCICNTYVLIMLVLLHVYMLFTLNLCADVLKFCLLVHPQCCAYSNCTYAQLYPGMPMLSLSLFLIRN